MKVVEVCPYNNLLNCNLAKCILVKELSEDAMDSFFLFLETFKKEKRETYDQLVRTCCFFEEKVEEILNREVEVTHDEVYGPPQ